MCGMLLSSTAWAQDASVAGVVRDATGGVMPGVTVEASSPVLIEGVRIAITDGEGLFNIINLRPGTYTVTLPGVTVEASSPVLIERQNRYHRRRGLVATLPASARWFGKASS